METYQTSTGIHQEPAEQTVQSKTAVQNQPVVNESASSQTDSGPTLQKDNPELLKAVRKYRRRGLTVTPIKPREKIAILKDWPNVNLSEEDLKKHWGNHNIGIVCGGKERVVVIDFDDETIFEDWNLVHGRVTPLCKTAKGYHVYFTWDINQELPSNGKIYYKGKMAGDIKSHHGYVLAPPSIHPSGIIYKWISSPDMASMRTIAGLEELGLTRDKPVALQSRRSVRPVEIVKGSTVLEEAKAVILAAENGHRNEIINKELYKLAQKASAGMITTEEIWSLLPTAEEMFKDDPGDLRALKNVFESAINKGVQNPWVSNFKLTDLGNIERFCRDWIGELKYVIEMKGWYCWDGQRWVEDPGRIKVMDRSKITVRNIYREAAECKDDDLRKKIVKWGQVSEGSTKINAMMRDASMAVEFGCSIDEFDHDNNLFNVLNGTVNLLTGHFQNHCREDMITKMSPVMYDAEAKCPQWDQTVNAVFESDTEVIEYVQRACGYTLTGDIKEQCFFYNYGKGMNGKSTILETLYQIMGDYSKRVETQTFMAGMHKSSGGASPDIARLRGARYILASEVEDGQRLNESLIKDMTGGDTITARHLFKGYFDFMIVGKIWMFGNYQPHVRGMDVGIKRRVKMLGYNNIFQNPDKNMFIKLKDEYPGILNWMIEGCLKWQEDGLHEPEIVKKETEEYFADNDQVGQFIEDCLKESEQGYSIDIPTVYTAYKNWDEGGYMLSKNKFTRELRERGFTIEVGNSNVKQIKGWVLTNDEDKRLFLANN